jgi:hypothetical protein
MEDEHAVVLLIIMLGSMTFMVGLVVNTWYIPILAVVMIAIGIVYAMFHSYMKSPGRSFGKSKPKHHKKLGAGGGGGFGGGGKPLTKHVKMDPFTKSPR